MGKSDVNHSMDRTRLTRVLAALVASMTIGAMLLYGLRPRNVLSTEATYLAATYQAPDSTKISRTELPIDGSKWKAVVIHVVGSDLRLPCLGGDGKTTPPLVHFAVSSDADILITTQWAKQEHVEGYPWVINVGLRLAPGCQDASLAQAEALVSLLKNLQARCHIPAKRVYLHSELSDRPCGPDPLYRFNWRAPNVLLP